jgi:flagellar biosynthesis/type III secretory pathway protein FliH
MPVKRRGRVLDTKIVNEVLGAAFVQQTHALVAQAQSKFDPSNDRARDALVDLLIAMIIRVLGSKGSEAEFVSRLDNCVERLRSEGMASRQRSGK